MDGECGALIAAFLSRAERWRLRAVCRRWHFTCPWLQLPVAGESGDTADVALAYQPRRSALNTSGRAFRCAWQSLLRRECELLLPLLLAELPAADERETRELTRGLCLATNTGTRPSFGNARARSGYVAAKMNRCGNLPGLLLTPQLAPLRSELFRCGGDRRWRVALFGGGPGYEAVGLAVLRRFLRADRDAAFDVTVYDNEPGWEPAVAALQRALRARAFAGVVCGFKSCDITLDARAAANADVGEAVAAADLFVFSFVCVENLTLLERSDYCFLRALFRGARRGSHFVFTDVTHRLWPTVHALAAASGGAFRAWTPYARGCHFALVLKKEDARALSRAGDGGLDAAAAAKLALFRRHHAVQRRAERMPQAAASPPSGRSE